MDEKIKVRDLAAETGRSTTDVMRVLREEGIDFKTASSSISREDAEKVKAHFQPEAEKTVSRKEVQPGVIVRRRRRDTEETPSTSAPEGERSAPETMPSEKGKTSVEESVDSAPAGDIPAPADPSAENETGEGGQGARAAKSKKARPAESVSARIVRPARVVEDVRTKASAVSAPVPEENPAAGKEQVPSAEARSDGRPQAVPETGKSGAVRKCPFPMRRVRTLPKPAGKRVRKLRRKRVTSGLTNTAPLPPLRPCRKAPPSQVFCLR